MTRYRVLVSQWVLVEFAVTVEAGAREAAELAAVDKLKAEPLRWEDVAEVRLAGEVVGTTATELTSSGA